MKNSITHKLTLICLIASAGLLAACQPSSPNKESINLTYQYNHNGCDTGEHSFNSLAEYCAGLMDENLNNSCAVGSRETEYRNRCQANVQKSDSQFFPLINIETKLLNKEVKVISENSEGRSVEVTGTLSVDKFSSPLVDTEKDKIVSFDLAANSHPTYSDDDGTCSVELKFQVVKLGEPSKFSVLIHETNTPNNNCIEEELKRFEDPKGTKFGFLDIHATNINGEVFSQPFFILLQILPN